MSIVSWFRDILPSSHHDSAPAFENEKYHEARRLIGDVIGQAGDLNNAIRNRQRHPFVSIPLALRRQRELSEYDQEQVTDIYNKLHER